MSRDLVEKPATSRPWPRLGIAAVCLLLPAPLWAAPAPVVTWPTAQYNPNPLPDDLILPLPCGGAMAFRPATAPAQPELAPKAAGRDFSAVAGPFRNGQGKPRLLVGKYEVNRLQVAAVGAFSNGSACPSPQLPDGRLAASTIGWQEAMTFGDDWTGWLLAQGQAISDCTDGAGPCVPRADSGPAEVRLPSEAEWEFAARGGLAVTPETFAQSRYPMPDGIDGHAWSKENAGGQVHPIGTRGASPLGLHDLYGNVSEMLLERALGASPQGQTPVFVVRGGGRYDPSEKLTADLRYEVPIHNEVGRTRTSDTGFRVVVSTVGVPKVVPPAPTGDAQDPSHTLEVSGGTPMRKEVEPDLTDEERREIRGQLDRLGLNPGPPPGGLWFAVLDLLRRLGIGHGPDLLGERARGALATFQKGANLEASGLVTAETRQTLRVAVDALIATELAEAQRQRQAEQERLARQAVLDILLPMANLPGSSFNMGRCSNPYEGCGNEYPVHPVTVRPFRMGKYNVTQEQWQTIMGANPSQFKGDDRPVDSVSWYDAQEFLKRLNAQFPGKPYRLPTEAEWEYAALSGVHSDYCSECASVLKGNVLEWVQDCYHDGYLGAPSDGSEWRGGHCLSATRVVRGGPWLKLDWYVRVTSRSALDPGDRYNNLGLRLAQDL